MLSPSHSHNEEEMHSSTDNTPRDASQTQTRDLLWNTFGESEGMRTTETLLYGSLRQVPHDSELEAPFSPGCPKRLNIRKNMSDPKNIDVNAKKLQLSSTHTSPSLDGTSAMGTDCEDSAEDLKVNTDHLDTPISSCDTAYGGTATTPCDPMGFKSNTSVTVSPASTDMPSFRPAYLCYESVPATPSGSTPRSRSGSIFCGSDSRAYSSPLVASSLSASTAVAGHGTGHPAFELSNGHHTRDRGLSLASADPRNVEHTPNATLSSPEPVDTAGFAPSYRDALDANSNARTSTSTTSAVAPSSSSFESVSPQRDRAHPGCTSLLWKLYRVCSPDPPSRWARPGPTLVLVRSRRRGLYVSHRGRNRPLRKAANRGVQANATSVAEMGVAVVDAAGAGDNEGRAETGLVDKEVQTGSNDGPVGTSAPMSATSSSSSSSEDADADTDTDIEYIEFPQIIPVPLHVSVNKICDRLNVSRPTFPLMELLPWPFVPDTWHRLVASVRNEETLENHQRASKAEDTPNRSLFRELQRNVETARNRTLNEITLGSKLATSVTSAMKSLNKDPLDQRSAVLAGNIIRRRPIPPQMARTLLAPLLPSSAPEPDPVSQHADRAFYRQMVAVGSGSRRASEIVLRLLRRHVLYLCRVPRGEFWFTPLSAAPLRIKPGKDHLGKSVSKRNRGTSVGGGNAVEPSASVVVTSTTKDRAMSSSSVTTQLPYAPPISVLTPGKESASRSTRPMTSYEDIEESKRILSFEREPADQGAGTGGRDGVSDPEREHLHTHHSTQTAVPTIQTSSAATSGTATPQKSGSRSGSILEDFRGKLRQSFSSTADAQSNAAPASTAGLPSATASTSLSTESTTHKPRIQDMHSRSTSASIDIAHVTTNSADSSSRETLTPYDQSDLGEMTEMTEMTELQDLSISSPNDPTPATLSAPPTVSPTASSTTPATTPATSALGDPAVSSTQAGTASAFCTPTKSGYATTPSHRDLPPLHSPPPLFTSPIGPLPPSTPVMVAAAEAEMYERELKARAFHTVVANAPLPPVNPGALRYGARSHVSNLHSNRGNPVHVNAPSAAGSIAGPGSIVSATTAGNTAATNAGSVYPNIPGNRRSLTLHRQNSLYRMESSASFAASATALVNPLPPPGSHAASGTNTGANSRSVSFLEESFPETVLSAVGAGGSGGSGTSPDLRGPRHPNAHSASARSHGYSFSRSLFYDQDANYAPSSHGSPTCDAALAVDDLDDRQSLVSEDLPPPLSSKDSSHSRILSFSALHPPMHGYPPQGSRNPRGLGRPLLPPPLPSNGGLLAPDGGTHVGAANAHPSYLHPQGHSHPHAGALHTLDSGPYPGVRYNPSRGWVDGCTGVDRFVDESSGLGSLLPTKSPLELVRDVLRYVGNHSVGGKVAAFGVLISTLYAEVTAVAALPLVPSKYILDMPFGFPQELQVIMSPPDDSILPFASLPPIVPKVTVSAIVQDIQTYATLLSDALLVRYPWLTSLPVIKNESSEHMDDVLHGSKTDGTTPLNATAATDPSLTASASGSGSSLFSRFFGKSSSSNSTANAKPTAMDAQAFAKTAGIRATPIPVDLSGALNRVVTEALHAVLHYTVSGVFGAHAAPQDADALPALAAACSLPPCAFGLTHVFCGPDEPGCELVEQRKAEEREARRKERRRLRKERKAKEKMTKEGASMDDGEKVPLQLHFDDDADAEVDPPTVDGMKGAALQGVDVPAVPKKTPVVLKEVDPSNTPAAEADDADVASSNSDYSSDSDSDSTTTSDSETEEPSTSASAQESPDTRRERLRQRRKQRRAQKLGNRPCVLRVSPAAELASTLYGPSIQSLILLARQPTPLLKLGALRVCLNGINHSIQLELKLNELREEKLKEMETQSKQDGGSSGEATVHAADSLSSFQTPEGVMSPTTAASSSSSFGSAAACDHRLHDTLKSGYHYKLTYDTLVQQLDDLEQSRLQSCEPHLARASVRYDMANSAFDPTATASPPVPHSNGRKNQPPQPPSGLSGGGGNGVRSGPKATPPVSVCADELMPRLCFVLARAWGQHLHAILLESEEGARTADDSLSAAARGDVHASLSNEDAQEQEDQFNTIPAQKGASIPTAATTSQTPLVHSPSLSSEIHTDITPVNLVASLMTPDTKNTKRAGGKRNNKTDSPSVISRNLLSSSPSLQRERGLYHMRYPPARALYYMNDAFDAIESDNIAAANASVPVIPPWARFPRPFALLAYLEECMPSEKALGEEGYSVVSLRGALTHVLTMVREIYQKSSTE